MNQLRQTSICWISNWWSLYSYSALHPGHVSTELVVKPLLPPSSSLINVTCEPRLWCRRWFRSMSMSLLKNLGGRLLLDSWFWSEWRDDLSFGARSGWWHCCRFCDVLSPAVSFVISLWSRMSLAAGKGSGGFLYTASSSWQLSHKPFCSVRFRADFCKTKLKFKFKTKNYKR